MSETSKQKRAAARAPAVSPPPAPPGLVVIRVACADLHLDPANVRGHDDTGIGAIAAALAAYGQQSPIVIDSQDVVRKGNGTLLAARKLGWDALDCVVTGLSGVKVVGYAIADNRTSDLSHFIDEDLARTLRALQGEPGFDLDAVGYTSAEVDALLEGLATAAAPPPPGPSPDPGTGGVPFHECPACGHQWA
jgi:ParB-like chromosome segregation protein Spo0J